MSNSEKYYANLQKKYSRRISLGLERINKALKKLNNPHLKLNNPINIIGSDGKYSTLFSLKTFIEAAGYKTTSFISPHLYKFETRISLINKYISLNEIKKYEKVVNNLNIKLSLFEVLTLIYILAASKKKDVNYNLVEAGLLFKGDSTRLWKNPFLQICTNINKQHIEWINPKTINEICKQKVGYLSNNTNIYYSETGVASKDSSIANFDRIYLDKSKTCFAAYNKKQEFNGGIINSNFFQCKNYENKLTKDSYSKIIIENNVF